MIKTGSRSQGVTAIALLMLAAHANAQPTRLTPPEPFVAGVAPQYATLMGIDGTDSMAYAVWGTNVAIGGIDVAGAIYGQLLVNGAPALPPRRITAPDARPFEHCAVVVVGGRFAVLWNDMRSDTSIRLQLIDRTGAFEGSNAIFSDGVMVPWGSRGIAQTLGAESGGRLVVWRDARDPSVPTYGRRIEADGALGIEQRLGSTLETIAQYSTRPGLTFIIATDSTTVVNSDGAASPRRLPSLRFRLPHSLTADGRLFALTDTSLLEYAPYDAAEPSRAIATPAVAISDRRLRAVSIPVDDTIRLHCGYLVSDQYYFNEFRIVGDAVVDTLFEFRTSFGPEPMRGYNYQHWHMVSLSRDQPCGNGTLMRLTAQYEWFGGSKGYSSLLHRIIIHVSEDGRLAVGASASPPPCHPPQRYNIERRNSRDTSRVLATVDSTTAELAVASSGFIQNRLQVTPAIMVSGDSTLVAWQQDSVQGTINLGRWHGAPVDTVDPASSMGPDRLALISTPAMIVAVRCDVIDKTGYIGDKGVLGQYAIFGVRNGKLILVVQTDAGFWGQAYASGTVVDVAADPNTGVVHVVTAMTGAYYGDQNYFNRVSPFGTLVQPADTTLKGRLGAAQIVPLTDSTDIVLVDTIARVRARGAWLDTFLLPPVPLPAEYERLHGDRFARWFFTDSLHRRVSLQTFSTDGAPLDTASIESAERITDLCLLPDGRDSGMAILFCSRGLHVSRFTATLTPGVADSVLVTSRFAAMPAAAWRGDTLLIAWQDSGVAGGRDIFGMRHYLPVGSVSAVRDPAPGTPTAHGVVVDDTAVRIVPNPAISDIDVICRLEHSSDNAVEIVDPLGRLVLRQYIGYCEPGRHTIRITSGALPPGIYCVRVTSRNEVHWSRFVIAR